MPSPLLLALALLAVPAVALAAIAGRRTLLLALPFLATLNGLALPLGGASARADQLAACLLVVPLAAAAITGARTPRGDRTVAWLGAVLAANVVASVLHSPARGYSLQQCANLAATWGIYVVLLAFLDERDTLDAFVRRVLQAGIVGCGLAIGAFLLAAIGVPVGGADVSRSAAERLTRAFGAYGTMVEPNILGSFAAAHLVLAAGLLAAGARAGLADGERRLARWLAGVAGVALLLSFTRAAWVGAAAGVLAVTAVAARGAGLRARLRALALPVVIAVGVALVAGVAVVALPGHAGTVLRFKLLNLVNFNSQTALLRLLTYGLAVQQTVEHPIIGWGTFTFAPLVAQGTDFQQFESWRNLWIGNWLLLALHDTGVIGLALWLGLLTSILRRAARAAGMLRGVDDAMAARTVALTTAVVTLLVPFLATTGFSLGYPWLLIGLLGAHCRSAEEAAAPSPASVLSADREAPPAAALPADAT